MKRAGKRGLKADAMRPHPIEGVGGVVNGDPGQLLIAQSASHALIVIPHFLFRIGTGIGIDLGLVREPQIARMAAIAAP